MQGGQARFEIARLLMQLRVLNLDFFQDGNVRVGVFRERRSLGMHSSLVPRRVPSLLGIAFRDVTKRP